MDFKEAQYIIIGMQCGWLIAPQRDCEEAINYVIKHIDRLEERKLTYD